MTNYSKLFNISVTIILLVTATAIVTPAQAANNVTTNVNFSKVELNLNTTSFNSPYGKITVDNETLKKIGKDEIIQKYQTQVLSIKTAEKNGSLANLPINISNAAYNSISSLSILPDTNQGTEAARTKMGNIPGHSPTMIYGQATLSYNNPSGDTWADGNLFEEHEIYLLGSQGGEFVITYNDNGRCDLGTTYFPYGQGGNVEYGPAAVNIPLGHTYTYEFYVSPNDHTYNYWWVDDNTGDSWYYCVWPSDYNVPFSSQIYAYNISTEFWSCDINMNNYLLLQTQFTDLYTMVNGNWDYIANQFNIITSNQRNVPCHSTNWENSNLYIVGLSQIGYNPYP